MGGEVAPSSGGSGVIFRGGGDKNRSSVSKLSASLVRVEFPGGKLLLDGCAGGRRRFGGTPVREKVLKYIEINLQGKSPSLCPQILFSEN